MEEITKRYAGIKLSAREDVEVTILEPEIEDGFILVGKFFTKRRINLESVTRVMKTVWKVEKNFEASDLGENKRLPIFCYLCGRVDHDERDCLQGLRSKETLQPEEKQFDPWLRATQEKLQKPLIVTAARNEAMKISEAENQLREHNLVGIAERIPVSGTSRANLPGRSERWVEARADMGSVISMSSHIQVNTLKVPRISNFEQQLRDIDAAISGEVPDVIIEPNKEEELETEQFVLNRTVDSLETKEMSHANGLGTEAHSQNIAPGLQGPIMKMENQPGNVLGLSQSGFNFKMGPISPKQSKPNKSKKSNGGGRKKNKENNVYVGTNMEAGKEHMQPLGENKGVEMVMEVDQVEVGTKRRLRSPLYEVGNCIDNGKKANWRERSGSLACC
ncbi:hypothetical protein SO802_017776 [Lithocarpus litseifolius]|uniref:CCHC-type domain-containing protein n=1 Tax=Lithocarpus litseifolius TaxID=425828 RepID=A0AAW2CKA4_9ROSI